MSLRLSILALTNESCSYSVTFLYLVQALHNYKMRFLNVQATNLTGCPHIALHNILTTQDVIKLTFLLVSSLLGSMVEMLSANYAMILWKLQNTFYHPAGLYTPSEKICYQSSLTHSSQLHQHAR